MTRSNLPANIHANAHDHNIAGFWHQMSIGWDMDGARFHVWLRDVRSKKNARKYDANGARLIGTYEADELQMDDVIFKNPPTHIERRQPGHFDTRRLDASKKVNQALITAVLQHVREHRLVEQEIDRLKAIDAKLLAASQKRECLAKAVLEAGADVSRGSGRQPTYQELVQALAWHHNRDNYHHDDEGRRYKHAVWCLIENAGGADYRDPETEG